MLYYPGSVTRRPWFGLLQSCGKVNNTHVNKETSMRLRLVVNTMVEMNRDLLRCERNGFGKAETSYSNLGSLLCCTPWIRMWPYRKLGSETQKSPTFEGVGLKCRVLIASIYSHRLSMWALVWKGPSQGKDQISQVWWDPTPWSPSLWDVWRPRKHSK